MPHGCQTAGLPARPSFGLAWAPGRTPAPEGPHARGSCPHRAAVPPGGERRCGGARARAALQRRAPGRQRPHLSLRHPHAVHDLRGGLRDGVPDGAGGGHRGTGHRLHHGPRHGAPEARPDPQLWPRPAPAALDGLDGRGHRAGAGGLRPAWPASGGHRYTRCPRRPPTTRVTERTPRRKPVSDPVPTPPAGLEKYVAVRRSEREPTLYWWSLPLALPRLAALEAEALHAARLVVHPAAALGTHAALLGARATPGDTAAVRDVQRLLALRADGAVGPLTAALFPASVSDAELAPRLGRFLAELERLPFTIASHRWGTAGRATSRASACRAGQSPPSKIWRSAAASAAHRGRWRWRCCTGWPCRQVEAPRCGSPAGGQRPPGSRRGRRAATPHPPARGPGLHRCPRGRAAGRGTARALPRGLAALPGRGRDVRGAALLHRRLLARQPPPPPQVTPE